jgi:hypothetical protein
MTQWPERIRHWYNRVKMAFLHCNDLSVALPYYHQMPLKDWAASERWDTEQ